MAKKFDPRMRRLWVHGPKPEYKLDTDWADQWYISCRTLGLVRPNQDRIILPGGNDQTSEFADFCSRILGFSPEQIWWTTGKSYLLDDDIYRELIPRIRCRFDPGAWEIVPYSVTAPFVKWARLTRISVFGDKEDWVGTYSNKGILHPTAISPRDPAFPLLSEEVPGTRTPAGYTCLTGEELHAAYSLLREAGIAKFILKPVLGTTGEGIITFTDPGAIEGYAFPMGAVVLEECLLVDVDDQGKKISPSVQYIGLEMLGVTDQTFKGVSHEGNVIPSVTTADFQAELLGIAERILQWLKPQGPGGFDFLSVGGRPILVDPNVGRFTGAHPAQIFRNLYAPGMPFACWKIDPIRNLHDFWRVLESNGIAFRPSSPSAGVFPLCYLRGMWGLLVAFADNREELIRLRLQVENYL